VYRRWGGGSGRQGSVCLAKAPGATGGAFFLPPSWGRGTNRQRRVARGGMDTGGSGTVACGVQRKGIRCGVQQHVR